MVGLHHKIPFDLLASWLLPIFKGQRLKSTGVGFNPFYFILLSPLANKISASHGVAHLGASTLQLVPKWDIDPRIPYQIIHACSHCARELMCSGTWSTWERTRALGQAYGHTCPMALSRPSRLRTCKPAGAFYLALCACTSTGAGVAFMF